MSTKRHNPNNPINSTLLQGLQELQIITDGKAAELAAALIKLVIDDEDKSLRSKFKEADTMTARKMYPNTTIVFHQESRRVQVANFLTDSELRVLTIFRAAVDQNNLLRVSKREMAAAADMTPNAAMNAINGLIIKGCLAIKRERLNNNIAPVYMLNPEIATVGKSKTGRKEYLVKEFWGLTGSKYEDPKKPLDATSISFTHEHSPVYADPFWSVGSYSDGKPTDANFLRYNVLHFPKGLERQKEDEKKVISSSGNDETTPAENNDL